MSEPYDPRHFYNDHNYWLLCFIVSASRVVAMFASISSRRPISTGTQPNFFFVIFLDVGLFLSTAKERDPNFSAVCELLSSRALYQWHPRYIGKESPLQQRCATSNVREPSRVPRDRAASRRVNGSASTTCFMKPLSPVPRTVRSKRIINTRTFLSTSPSAACSPTAQGKLSGMRSSSVAIRGTLLLSDR